LKVQESIQSEVKSIDGTKQEKRIALIHRVLVPDEDYPREYALLITDTRTIFIRQTKTRRTFWLRGEMKWGTALITDVVPKTLENYAETSLESLAAEQENLNIPHESITSLLWNTGKEEFFWPSLRSKPVPVYNFVMKYRDSTANRDKEVRFHLVPLGKYFKPRRLTQNRETILHEYAMDVLKTFQSVLPNLFISRG